MNHMHIISIDMHRHDWDSLFELRFFGTWENCKRLASEIVRSTGYSCNLWQKRSYWYVMLGSVWRDGHYVGV